MNLSDLSFRPEPSDHTWSTENHPTSRKLGQILRAARASSNVLKPLAIFGMIGWLAVKDWLISGTAQYPYSLSSGVSLSIVLSALAAYTVSRASVWRNCVLGFFTFSCLIYLALSASKSDFWGIMPAAGIMTCALVFPWPADPRWFLSNRTQVSRTNLLRRRCYILAGFIGLSAFIMSHDSDLPAASFTVIAIVAVGFLLRCIVRSAAKTAPARILLIALYTICMLSYWVMSFSPLFTGSSWSFLGNGLGSGGTLDYRYCSDSLSEGGLISAVIRSVILTVVLLTNATAVLEWSRLGAAYATTPVQTESKEAMELSIAALISVLAQVFVLPIFAPAVWPDPTSAGYWTLTLSLASLCIATRTIKNTQKGSVPDVYIHGRIAGIFATVAAAGAILFLSLIPLFILVRSIEQATTFADKSTLIPLGAIPQTVQRAAVCQLPFSPSLINLHDSIRQACGAPVKPSPSLCTSLAYIATRGDRSPTAARTVKAIMLSLLINREVEPQKVLELYLNQRDYGAPEPGLRAASAYYFGKRLSKISSADATFMLSDPSYDNHPILAGFQSVPQPRASNLSTPRNYSYTELPAPAINTTYVHHDGMVNAFGEVVGTAFTKLGPCAYTWKNGEIRALPGDPHTTFAIANNSHGQVVGWSYDGSAQRAVMWDASGRIKFLGSLPDYPFSVARSINNKGQVVGYAFRQYSNAYSGAKLDSDARAFLWQSGKMIDLGRIDGCSSSRAYAINDSGQIAGWVLTNGGATHAMVYRDGVMHDIGTLGGQTSMATAINNLGQVVGSAQRINGTVASFVWQNGVMHDIGVIGNDPRGRAWSINDYGQIVGLSYGANVDLNGPGGHPYIWDSDHGIRPLSTIIQGNPTDIHRLFQYYTVFSINNTGEILGLSYLHNTRSMFLLKPTFHSALR